MDGQDQMKKKVTNAYIYIHKDKVIDENNTAAARAVACIELKK